MTKADFREVWRLDGQKSFTLGSLQGTDVGAPYWPIQVPWGKASRLVGDLSADVDEVCFGGDGVRGQGFLRYIAALRWHGGRD